MGKPVCIWHAECLGTAHGTVSHPSIGQVPVCAACATEFNLQVTAFPKRIPHLAVREIGAFKWAVVQDGKKPIAFRATKRDAKTLMRSMNAAKSLNYRTGRALTRTEAALFAPQGTNGFN